MPIEQDPGSEHVEAVASSHPLNRPDEVVGRFRTGVRDPVVEKGQDRPLPVMEGRQERTKSGPDLRIKTGVPFFVSFCGFGPGGCLVDVVEPLLRLVSLGQDWEVPAPFLKALFLDLVQVRRPLEEEMAIPHEGSPFLGGKSSSHGLSEGVQGGVGHFHDMELVHDDGDPEQGVPDGILVRTPHVEDHTPDSSFIGKIRKIPAHGCLVPVGEHFDHIAGRDVGENRPGPADQVDLVDSQDFRGLEPEGVLKLPPLESITSRIFLIRGQKVMLDSDLADLYGVTTSALNQSVKRNKDRFPSDFVFQLTGEEKEEVVTNCDHLSRLKFSPTLPYAFTEHGALMLGNVLKSPRAIQVSLMIVRAFVKLREMLSTHKEVAQKIEELERKLAVHDEAIIRLFEAIRQLMEPPMENRKQIGFTPDKE